MEYKGSIIAYIFQPEDGDLYKANETQGIIATPSHQRSTHIIPLCNASVTTTGATGTAISAGQANTIAIVTNQGDGRYAAQLCNDLELDGYGVSDQFLFCHEVG